MSQGEKSNIIKTTENDSNTLGSSSSSAPSSSSSSSLPPRQPTRSVTVESRQSSTASASSSGPSIPPLSRKNNSGGYDSWTRGTASTGFSPPKTNAPRRQGRPGQHVVLTANPNHRVSAAGSTSTSTSTSGSGSADALRSSQGTMKTSDKASTTSGFLREGGSPQIGSITADLNQAARENNKSDTHTRKNNRNNAHIVSNAAGGVKRETSNSSLPTASVSSAPVSMPTIQGGGYMMRQPAQLQVQVPVQGDMSQYYYYHGIARSPVRNAAYVASYQQGLMSGIHPSPFPSTAVYHGTSSQDQVPLKSPPGAGGYNVNNATNRGAAMFYIAPSSVASPQKLPPSSSSSSATLPSNIPKVDSMTSKGDETMMRKMGPLLRSPPPKKRRIVGSWDESDRKDDLDIGMPSPGVFRSPIDGKIRGRGFTMDPKRSPLFSGTPNRFAFSESISFGMDTPGKLSADIFEQVPFEQSPARFEQTPRFDLDPQPFSLPGIDTSNEDEELGGSPNPRLNGTEQIKDDSKQDKPSLWNLSPIQHGRLTSPSPKAKKEDETEEEKGEHFPFKSFTPKVLSSASRNKENISVPSLSSADKSQSSNLNNMAKPTPSPTTGMETYRPQPSPYIQHRVPYPSPPGFRMEIGGVGGMKQSEARRGMDGINTAINGGRTNPPHEVTGSLQTPIKIGMAPVSTPSSMAVPVYPGSTPRHGPGALATSLYPMSAPRHHPPIIVAGTPSSVPPNKAKPSPQLKRRQPCNCKKSKCLKLYCECFAAQLFCDGCNCNDCHNTPNHEALRNKAIKDTKAKNPSAFKSKTNSKQSTTHTSGCKCKKSACLKKYCECFEAGIMCGPKCKCANCQNYPGSQMLIERRRKIKDHKGVEMAMRTKEPIKGKGLQPVSIVPGHPIFPSPAPVMPGHRIGMHQMMSPQYMGRPAMMMNHMGYSPMSFPPGTPAYNPRIPHHPQHPTPQMNPQRTPLLKTPKTPVARRDPASAKKANKGAKEEKKVYFGPRNGIQTKSSALAILSFLSNEEIYNASVVSKTWCKLALDDELWQFE